jgi:hypothetical protein
MMMGEEGCVLEGIWREKTGVDVQISESLGMVFDI